jgi:hypothetical protein
VPFPDHLKGHQTSPFVWLETSSTNGENKITPIGGGDRFREWVNNDNELNKNADILEWATLGSFGAAGNEIAENNAGWDPATAN